MPHYQYIVRGLCLACLFQLTASGLGIDNKNAIRDPEVIYLPESTSEKAFVLKVLKATAVYADRTRQAYMKNFSEGEQVQLLALGPDSYYVRNTRTGYEGWVQKDTLSAIDKAQLNAVLSQAAEEEKFATAIRKKEILPGMNFDQVKAALGKPGIQTFRQDENGRSDKWSYVDYDIRYENQTSYDAVRGVYINTAVPIKVAVGSLDIEFRGGRVTAIERTRDKNIPRY